MSGPSGRMDNPQAAVYVRRLVVSRRYASHELGAALLDWADWAKKHCHAKLMRIDVWTIQREPTPLL